MAYTTADAVLAQLSRQGSAPASRLSTLVPGAIETADAWIDNHCGRTFERSKSAVPREFRGPRPTSRDSFRKLRVGDITTATLVECRARHSDPWVAVDAAGWTLDWDLNSEERGFPYDVLWALPDGPIWPTAPAPVRTVRVTGVWGWTAVPADVTQAATLFAGHQALLLSGPMQAGEDLTETVFGSQQDYMEIRRLLAPYRTAVGP